MKYESENALCRDLAERFVGLRSVYDEQIQDFDELLSHMFLADVTRYVLAKRPETKEIVQTLEDVFAQRSEAVENLIQVSFVENIESETELETILEGVSGSSLREEWKRQHASQ